MYPDTNVRQSEMPPALSWETEELYAKAKEIVVVSNGDRRSLGDFGAGVF